LKQFQNQTGLWAKLLGIQMLDSMRNMMGGALAKILIGLLVISFAVWGASDAFIGGAATNAVTVGETRVGLVDYRLAYLNQTNALQSQLGQRLSREQLQAFGVEQAVLSQVVTGAVLDESARKMQLGISEDRLAQLIGDDPNFQDSSGNFSRQRLDFLMQNAGMREEDFIRNRTTAAVRNQLVSGLAAGTELPDVFFEAFADYQSQRRVFEYINIGAEDIESIPEPTEEDLTTYYEANKDDYVAPEYRKLVIVRLTAEDIARLDQVTQAELEQEYERSKTRYTTPERRQIWQLNFPDETAAAEAQTRLETGETFEELMAELGRSDDDVDLGLLTREQIPEQNIASAAFMLDEGETSDVVNGVFGPVILKVVSVEPEASRAMDEIEDELRQTVAIEKATEEIYDIHDRLEDARAAGDSLAQAAQEAGLEARTIEMIDAEGRDSSGEPVEDIPEEETLLREAFQTEIGIETDPLPIGSEGFVWYDVVDIIDERQKPLSEVRSQVEQAWIIAETYARTQERAETMRDRVAAGEEFAEVAADILPAGNGQQTVELNTSDPLQRNQAGDALPTNAVTAGFSVGEGAIYTAQGQQPTDSLVIRVREVLEGQSDQVSANRREQLNNGLADSIIGSVVTDLQSGVDVSINQQAIETAITY
jgi:peptidyl-prolyl cis-trans isomerase D